MKTFRKLEKEFQEFINNIPNYINEFKNLLNKKKLTYSPKEIDEIQMYFLKNYKKNKKLEIFTLSYFGTAWMWHFGGEWYFEDNKNSDQYGMFCIQKYGGTNYPWISLNLLDWLDAIKDDFLDESIGSSFQKLIDFHRIHPEHVIDFVRNIN